MRKMALTVPGEATRLTGRSRHRGNCALTRSRTTAAETGSSPACMAMAASFPAAGGGPQPYFTRCPLTWCRPR